MNNVGGHIAILAGAGLAAVAVSALMHPGQRTETASTAQAPVVVTLPPRTSGPVPPSPASAAPRPSATPGDRVSLARQLQIELRRVGCYAGEINGAWTTPTRAAMKTFTDKVNALLPIDKPDYILLALVQGHRQRVCGPVDTLAPAPAIAAAPKLLSPPAPAMRAAPRLLAPPTPATHAAPRIEPSPRPPAARAAPAPESPAAPTPPGERPHRNAQHDGPVPAVGVYERRGRRSLRPSPQLRYARSLVRSLKRAAMMPLRLP